MPLIKGYSQRSISKNIQELIRSGYDPNQASAISYDVARKARKRAGKSVGKLRKPRKKK